MRHSNQLDKLHSQIGKTGKPSRQLLCAKLRDAACSSLATTHQSRVTAFLIATVADSRFDLSACNQTNSRFSNRNKNAVSGIVQLAPFPSPACPEPAERVTSHQSPACPDGGRVTAFLIANPAIRIRRNSCKFRHIEISNRQLSVHLDSESCSPPHPPSFAPHSHSNRRRPPNTPPRITPGELEIYGELEDYRGASLRQNPARRLGGGIVP
jgi:hypothetical protein